MMNIDFVPDYCLKPTLILGCGSIFRGDDGFGSRVIQFLLDHYSVPEDVAVMDAGSGVGEILLDIALSPEKPKKIALVDAMDQGLPAGAVSVKSLEDFPNTQMKFLSPHQGPTSSLLRELGSLGIDVILITVQPESIPDHLTIGLSPSVQNAFNEICQIILKEIIS
jgi:coenzyme F420 hydrogenase subunit delta